MAKYSQKSTPSIEVQQEAQAIARATQKPGQSKEQTRLIAQGIQKGIEQYKKQHKSKSRELNKKLKKLTDQPSNHTEKESNIPATKIKQHWLPWLLLLTSWLGMAIYLFTSH